MPTGTHHSLGTNSISKACISTGLQGLRQGETLVFCVTFAGCGPTRLSCTVQGLVATVLTLSLPPPSTCRDADGANADFGCAQGGGAR